MVGYYVRVFIVSTLLGVSLFLFLQLIASKYNLSDHDARGYFILAMLFSTLISAALAYLGGQKALTIDNHLSDLLSPSLGVLLSVGLSIVILAIGLLNVKKIK